NRGAVYGEVTEAAAITTVRRAFELGINVFDASPFYGLTRGETMLGLGLRGLPRDRYVLLTKCGRYDADHFDFSPARIRASVTESLRRLRTDHVDVFQLHDVEFGDLDRILHESLPVLHELRATGKVRFVGITGLPLRIFRRALELGVRLDTVLSYCHATLFDNTLVDLLPALAGRGRGVINASPAAMGLLSKHGPRDWHPAPPEVREACAKAQAHCARRGADLAELAVQFACSIPGIATTLCGTAVPDEIAANVR